MATKRELWNELGKRYGIPAKGTVQYEFKKGKYQQALIDLNITDDQPVKQQQAVQPHCSCTCYCGARGDQPPMSHSMGYAEQVPSANTPPVPRSRPVPRTVPVQQYRPEQIFDSDEEELNDRQYSNRGRRVRVISESESSSSEDSDSEYERRKKMLQKKKAVPSKKAAESKKAQTKKKASPTKRK